MSSPAASSSLCLLPACPPCKHTVACDRLAQLAKLKVLQLDGNRIEALPAGLLGGCVSLHTLSLHDNPITPAQLEASPGFEGYSSRRRGKYDKGIAGGALLSSNGLDEGVDRLLK